MPTWKKVVVSGSGVSQLANDANYLIDAQSGAILTGSFSGSFQGDGSQLSGIATSLAVSGSTGNDSLNLKTEALNIVGDGAGISTSVDAVSNTISIETNGVVSGSSQVDITETTGYATYSGSVKTYADSKVADLSGSVGSLINPLDNRVDDLEAFSASLDSTFATEAEVNSAVDTLSGSAHTQRLAIESGLSTDISDEASARVAADNTLQGNIDSEESARIAADNTLQGNIDSLSGSAHVQREALVAGLDSDLSALSGSAHSQRVAIESSLDGKIGTEKGRIDAILSASVADTDTFAEIVELINSVDTENDQAFAGFVTSSNARATDIEDSVTALSSSAAVANTNLSSDLTDAYVAADSALSSSAHIAREALKDAQSTAYIAADTALSSSAHTQRLAIESSLSSDITTLESNTTAELNASSSALQSNIDAEETARIAADNTLQSNIDSLESSARAELNASSSTLQSNIDSEETARIAADNTLQSAIDSLSGSNATALASKGTELTSDFQAADTALSSSAHDQRVALATAQSTAYIAADTALSSSAAAALSIEQGRIDAILTGSQADKDSFAEIVTLINSVDTENDQAFAGFVTSSNARATAIETSVTNLSSSAATANTNLSSDLTSAYQTADTALSSSAHTQRKAIESGLTSDIGSLSGSAHTQRTALDSAQTTALSNVSGAFATTQATQDGRLSSLESFTASLDDTFATEAELNAATASVKTYADNAVDTLSGSAHIQRDALATSLASDISDEESARIAADNNLQGDIDSLSGSAHVQRLNIESGLSSDITSLSSSAATANANLLSDVASDISDLSGSAHTQRKAVESGLTSDISSLSGSAHSQRVAIETSLDGKIGTEKGRIDAILSASVADTDTFAEIVTLINSVDTENDQAFAGYVTSSNARQTDIENSVTALSSSAAIANANISSDLTAAYQAADTALSSSAHTQRLAIESGLSSDITSLSSSAAVANTNLSSDLTTAYTAADTSLSSSFADTIANLTNDYTELINIPAGIVSGSEQQLANLVGEDVVANSFTGDGSGLTNLTVDQTATVISTFTNETSVAVTHNFGSKNVLATVYEGDTQIIPASVTTTSDNVVTVTFNEATTGRVIVGKGGHVVSGSIPFANLLNTPTLVSGSEQVDLADTVGFTAYSASVEAKIDALDGTFATDVDITALSSSTHFQRVAIETGLTSDISNLSGSAHTQRVAIETSLQSNIDGAISTANSELNASSSALTTAYTAADSALSSSIATTISNLSSTISISGSTGNSDVNLITDDLSIVGVSGQTETTVSGTTVSVGFVTNPTVSGNLNVTGDLTVTGNTFEAQVTNLNVEDRFILLNSGSNTGDTGIIFGGSDGTANVGSGIFFDNPAGVFGFSQGIGSTDTSATHQSKIGNIETSASAPAAAPTFQGAGTIHVDSSSGDLYIYS